MGRGPWWNPSEDDLDWDPLPDVVILGPDYAADLPLWGQSCGNLAWQCTRFRPELLDRLAAWQEEFDDNFHYDKGWRSPAVRDRWKQEAEVLAADVRATLGSQAELVVDLWPLKDEE
jgi:hypothetical protein